MVSNLHYILYNGNWALLKCKYHQGLREAQPKEIAWWAAFRDVHLFNFLFTILWISKSSLPNWTDKLGIGSRRVKREKRQEKGQLWDPLGVGWRILSTKQLGIPWNARRRKTAQRCRLSFKEVASSSLCFQGQVCQFHSALFNDPYISTLCILTWKKGILKKRQLYWSIISTWSTVHVHFKFNKGKFDIKIHLWNNHHNQDIEHNHHLLKLPLLF